MRQLYATLLRKRRLQRQIAKDELVLESLNEHTSSSDTPRRLSISMLRSCGSSSSMVVAVSDTY
jgi:hypothetical protein